MQLGIDFGTTRSVVAVADRGNYPVISFQTNSGDSQLWYPSVVATRSGEILFSLDAESKHGEDGWYFLRSFKRLLANSGPDTSIRLGDVSLSVLELLTGFLSQLRKDLLKRSNLEATKKESLKAWVAVPANANSNQRFLTIEGFRLAGFHVLGMINEPSAAGIEYAQRYVKSGLGKREHLVVYDLGGGTFDVSVIGLKEHSEEILTNEGISALGGDDFDELLLELAFRHSSGSAPRVISESVRYSLLDECRRQKESLHPNTRKMVIDLEQFVPGFGEAVVSTDEFYRACAPLVKRTIEAVETAMERVTHQNGIAWDEVAAVYLVGGSSDLPVVARMMRELYGSRVRRSPYPYASTAIGLAILADSEEGYHLRERFTRYFGVWREAEKGNRIIFDPIFPKETPLPRSGEPPLKQTYSYRPAHPIGHYRYLECSQLQDGQPAGDLMPWDEILFPIDPELQDVRRLDSIPVQRNEEFQNQVMQEEYRCDHQGMIEVTIINQTAGYQRSYRLKRR